MNLETMTDWQRNYMATRYPRTYAGAVADRIAEEKEQARRESLARRQRQQKIDAENRKRSEENEKTVKKLSTVNAARKYEVMCLKLKNRRSNQKRSQAVSGSGIVRTNSQKIIQKVVFASDYSWQDFTSERRPKGLVRDRQALMYLLYKFTPFSLPQIGRRLGRDHSTVLYGVQKVKTNRAAFADIVDPVIEQLGLA